MMYNVVFRAGPGCKWQKKPPLGRNAANKLASLMSYDGWFTMVMPVDAVDEFMPNIEQVS